MAPAVALLGRARIILRLFEQLVAQLDSCRRAGARNDHAACHLGELVVATGARARALAPAAAKLGHVRFV